MKKKETDAVSFVAAGDVFLSGKIVRQEGTVKEVITYKSESVFKGVASLFQNADVAFCNLESALSDRGAPQQGRASAFPREAILFHCTFQKNALHEAWLQPVTHDEHAHPHPLAAGSESSRRVLSHLRELSKELGVSLRIKEGKAVIPLIKST